MPTVSNQPISSKLTQAQIAANQRRLETETQTAEIGTNKDNVLIEEELPLEENVNRLSVEGEVARSAEEAIRILR